MTKNSNNKTNIFNNFARKNDSHSQPKQHPEFLVMFKIYPKVYSLCYVSTSRS